MPSGISDRYGGLSTLPMCSWMNPGFLLSLQMGTERISREHVSGIVLNQSFATARDRQKAAPTVAKVSQERPFAVSSNDRHLRRHVAFFHNEPGWLSSIRHK